MRGVALLLDSTHILLLLLYGVGGCPPKCFCHPSAKWVDCSGQGLAEVPPDLPPQTLMLFLQDNRIRWLPALAFRTTPLLTTLNLSNNSLSSLTPESFYGLRHLRVLNLTQNSLPSLESSLAHTLPQLRELHLSYNNLRRLPTSLGQPWENLTVFAVQQNQLLHLERALLESMPSVRLVLLRDNLWRCDCHLLRLKLWLERFIFEGGVTDGVICGSPDLWKGQDLLSIPYELYQPCPLPSSSLTSLHGQQPGSAQREVAESPENHSGQQEPLDCENKPKPRPVNLRHALATVVITGVVCGIVCLMMLAAAIYGCTYAAITAQCHRGSLEPTTKPGKTKGKDLLDRPAA
uniref:leucine-rich repeat and transmembrane domain-containing protein 1 n=1 Tax=Jaculus jaculus TaxID=51337 RepID=UPI001E1B476C|nr:leucine-rich repeat and transmembrane domain-containing protein 1 [Jaculus jaculus]